MVNERKDLKKLPLPQSIKMTAGGWIARQKRCCHAQKNYNDMVGFVTTVHLKMEQKTLHLAKKNLTLTESVVKTGKSTDTLELDRKNIMQRYGLDWNGTKGN